METKLGKTIRILRQAKGLKVNDLAKQAAVSPSLISLIESSQRQPSIDILRRIADAVGVPSEAILMMAFKTIQSKDRKAGDIAKSVEQLIAMEEKLKAMLE